MQKKKLKKTEIGTNVQGHLLIARSSRVSTQREEQKHEGPGIITLVFAAPTVLLLIIPRSGEGDDEMRVKGDCGHNVSLRVCRTVSLDRGAGPLGSSTERNDQESSRCKHTIVLRMAYSSS